MCQFVEMVVPLENGREIVSVDQVDCNNPSCPSSDSNPKNK